jgi:hypothetical protein
MINITNELSEAHKKSLKEEIMDEITEKIIEKLQDMVNQKVQDALKKYQDSIRTKLKKTKIQLSELREDFNKHQSETKETMQMRYMK